MNGFSFDTGGSSVGASGSDSSTEAIPSEAIKLHGERGGTWRKNSGPSSLSACSISGTPAVAFGDQLANGRRTPDAT